MQKLKHLKQKFALNNIYYLVINKTTGMFTTDHFFFGDFLEKYASKKMLIKTILAPIHCINVRGFPKKITETKIVKNFLVVVIIDTSNGPNSDT